jgi:DNA gyrase subunit A
MSTDPSLPPDPPEELTLLGDLAADDEVEPAAPEPAVVRMDWDGEVIDFADAMRERSRAYASYVNTSRALPDIRDGLKPVQRRIIFGMNDLGVRNDRPYKKSALTVGSVMGTLHPHGDSAIYEAMVRMAQPHNGECLIEGQGNWGNLDGDPAAAMRYTEARLSALASAALTDLRPEVVPYRPNFSETMDEASVLPVVHPNLLTIGVAGIGWAMGCSVPTHNLAEAIDAAILLAERPDATLAQVMQRLPGPDFPGGGIVVNPERLVECYASGQGTVQVQGQFHVESVSGGRQAVVVTELPYQVGPSQLVAQIVKAARDGKITEITEMPRDLSSKDHPVRVMATCKRGGDVQTLIAQLLKHTKLRDSASFNMNVLVGGKPRVVSLVELLAAFVGFRHEVVTNRLAYEQSVLARDMHRLLALMAALDQIDAVVRIIRGAADDDDARAKLMALLRFIPHGATAPVPIDEQQANWILDMQLRRLHQLNRTNLADDIGHKGARLDEITAILASAHGVRDIVVSELRDTKKRFGTPRRTLVAGLDAPRAVTETGGGGTTAVVVATPVLVHVSAAGKAVVAEPPKRAVATSALELADADSLLAVVPASSTDALIAVSARGTVYRTHVGNPEGRRGRGRALVGLARGDRLAGVLVDSDRFTHALLVTSFGQIKRVEWELLAGSNPGGLPCFRVPDGDAIIQVVPHNADDQIICSTILGQALRIEAGKVRPVASGAAGGVAGMTLGGDDEIIWATRADGDDLVVVHETGCAKRVPLGDYPAKGRGGAGVVSAVPDKPTRDPAGGVSVAIATAADAALVVTTARGTLVALDVGDLTPSARGNASRRVFEVGPGDVVSGATVISG